MSYAEPREPHARALRDFFHGDTHAKIVVHSSLGEHEEIPVAIFFREPDFFPFEKAALALCRGRVLDVGAGTGLHSLYLQERGHDVIAIDILAEAVEIMRRCGVSDARVADVMSFEAEPFDTILMMMNGTGILGTLDGLDRFLRDVPRLLEPGGQILVDSGPPVLIGDRDDAAIVVPSDAASSYVGETWIRLEYKGTIGPPFRELYVDSETLEEHARAANWQFECVFRDEHGGHLARLTRV